MSTSAKPSPVPAAAAEAAAVPRRDDDVRRKLAIRKAYHTAYYEYQRRDMMYLLIILRFLNAISIRTFFQPDEYFQSLEPAWEMAFGASSGAWITWEWHHQLRSSLHPAIFALLYFVADRAMGVMSMYPQFKAIILAYLPKVFQGLVAAVGDYYTWQLAEKVYGQGSNAAFTTLLITALSPWQWFCSTRTLSNSLETVLTIVALYHWPWALYGDSSAPKKTSPDAAGADKADKATTSPEESQIFKTHADVNSLRICLFLAGIACLLRPTNLFIWASIVTVSVSRLGLTGTSPAKLSDFLIILRETFICGALALSISAASDYYYFGVWTFPPYQWLYFNITKSLAVFYGTNRWDYYVTEGLPLLLTTIVPFTLIAFVSSTSIGTEGASVSNIRFQFTFTALTTIATLSLISHKEVRFIYPLLPLLHILTAPHILSFFSRPTPTPTTPASTSFAIPPSPTLRRTTLLGALIAINISLAFYTTLIHQRGVLDVLAFLRYDYEATHLTERGLFIPTTADDAPFAAFLMPCHSTPWRSHLVHPTLNAWALTCEPPLDIPAGTPERAAYRDEADRFFDDPKGFLSREVGSREKPWPQYVVGFEGIEGVLVEWHEETGSQYEVLRKWSGFNSHWIDDERRQGRVVVWEFKERVKA